MSNNICKVTATSSVYPQASMEWAVDTTDDMKYSLVYTNMMYDIIGVAMAKLGVEYSKWLLDQDDERLACEVEKVQTALRTGTVVG